jgi:hypothetical protein
MSVLATPIAPNADVAAAPLSWRRSGKRCSPEGQMFFEPSRSST